MSRCGQSLSPAILNTLCVIFWHRAIILDAYHPAFLLCRTSPQFTGSATFISHVTLHPPFWPWGIATHLWYVHNTMERVVYIHLNPKALDNSHNPNLAHFCVDIPSFIPLYDVWLIFLKVYFTFHPPRVPTLPM